MDSAAPCRNLLLSGSSGVGKSSLGVTLARGVFPPPETVPARFEGWTITARPADFGLGLGVAGAPLKRTTSSSATSNASKGAVNLTLWEDWPRKRPKEEEEDSDDDDDEEEDEKKRAEDEQKENLRREKEDAVSRADAAQTKHVLTNSNSTSKNAAATTPSQQLRHHFMLRPLNSNSGGACVGARALGGGVGGGGGGADKDDDDPPPPPPCVPPRPILYPKPSVVILCFSSVNLDSFVEAETVLWPEMMERYPLVPVILVATKCDLKERDVCTSTANTIGGSSRSLYATYSSPGSPVPGQIPEGSEVPCAESDLKGFSRSISTDISLVGCQLSRQTAFRLGLSTGGSRDSDCSTGAGSLESSDSGDPTTRGQHGHEHQQPQQGPQPEKKRTFMVTSDMGVAMCKRIGASAYIECSAKEQKGLRPILQEALRLLTEKNPALKATASLPSSPLLAAAAFASSSSTKKSKKNSAPSIFPFASARSRVLGRGKAVSLNFIRGGSSGDKK